MANKKFSDFDLKTNSSDVAFVVGFNGTDNVRITPANLTGGGGASDLNGLTDCLVDTDSLYVGESPGSLSGNPQGNTVLGIDAGNALTTGINNTFIGNDAGVSATTTESNVFIGFSSGKACNTTAKQKNVCIGKGTFDIAGGQESVCIGFEAGRVSSTSSSVYVGYQSGWANSGGSNTALGRESLIGGGGDNSVGIGYQTARNNTTTGHVSIGYKAGYSQTSGIENTNVGYQAGTTNTTGGSNTNIGFQAGLDITTGSQNVLVGSLAGQNITTGGDNVVVGYEAANNLTDGTDNVCMGKAAFRNGQGSLNTAIGDDAMRGSGTRNFNTSLGALSGSNLTTGANNTVIGYNAQPSSGSVSNEITLGNANITSFRIPGIQSGASNGDVLTFNSSAGKLELSAAGGGGASSLNGLTDCLVATDSLYVGTVPSGLSGNPQDNTTLGINAGVNLTIGNENTLIGNDAGKSMTNGVENTAIGCKSFDADNQGHRNTAVGFDALGSLSYDGSGYNATLGWRAGKGLLGGFRNTILGANAGTSGTMNNNVNCSLLGYQAAPSSTSIANEITLGNSSITALRCAVTSITSLSDERDKSDIKDLEYGLAFIDALQPREFVWDNRAETRPEFDEDGNETEVEFYSDNKGKKDFGFIAQEVQELDNDTLRLVYTENEDKLELSYGKLVPILVKAIQELKEEVELLKS